MSALDIFGKRETPTRQEQLAFNSLANALIFEKPTDFKLSQKNVPALSHLLQDSFLQQDEQHDRAKHDYVDALITKSLGDFAKNTAGKNTVEMGIAKPDSSDEPAAKETPKGPPPEPRSEAEAFLSAARFYVSMLQLDESNAYGAWGFTPKLAGMRTKDAGLPFEKDGKNCFGTVQGLGALCRERGFSYEMGLTADHPFAIVNVEGVVYLASNFGIHEAKGTFETHDGYKMYKPSPADKLPYKLMAVWNFDEALVYELFENFEVLRQMSLGNDIENLPGTERRGMQIAQENKELLQATSWRALQEKLTPRLTKYFRDHQEEWADEIDKIISTREIKRFFKEVLVSAQSVTSFKDESFDSFKKIFLPVVKMYGKALTDLILSNIECAPGTPEEVVLFAKRAQELLAAIPFPELREAVTKEFLRPFTIDKKDVLTGE